jgi:hypothetical protein
VIADQPRLAAFVPFSRKGQAPLPFLAGSFGHAEAYQGAAILDGSADKARLALKIGRALTREAVAIIKPPIENTGQRWLAVFALLARVLECRELRELDRG